jgi:hypothetical protein
VVVLGTAATVTGTESAGTEVESTIAAEPIALDVAHADPDVPADPGVPAEAPATPVKRPRKKASEEVSS